MSEKSMMHGQFVWFDLMTTSLDASLTFYGKLFPEWQIEKMEVGPEMYYHMIYVGGRKTGGLVSLDAGGPPSHWISYVSVPDCDASVQQAVSLGGKVLVEAFTAPGVGRMAVIADPQGAYIKPFALEEPMEPVNMAEVGQFSWCELLTSDQQAAGTYYQKLFGWEGETEMMAEDFAYHILRNNGSEVGGIVSMPDLPPHWLPYITVDNVDTRAEAAKEAGGTVCQGPEDIPNVGRYAIINDPSGAALALYQSIEKG